MTESSNASSDAAGHYLAGPLWSALQSFGTGERMERVERETTGVEPRHTSNSDPIVQARNNDLLRLAQATDLIVRWTRLRSTAPDKDEQARLDELRKMLLQLVRRELALVLLQGGVLAMAPPPDELTAEELEELRRNAQAWKANEEECRRKTGLCGGAIEWVRTHGRFAPAGSGKTFGQAMGLGGGLSLEAAFRLAKLLGLLAQESSFGTNLGTSDTYKGPFQLSRNVVDDFNRHNDPDVQWPDDVDGAEDFETAARVAACRARGATCDACVSSMIVTVRRQGAGIWRRLWRR